MQRHLFVLFLLALTQITGTGAVSVLPVIATSAAKFQTSLPMNLISALAPPVLAGLMAGIGAHAVFAVLGTLSIMPLMVLWQLKRKRSWGVMVG